VQKLANEGFTHIELSGGTEHYDTILEDLLNLKKEFNLEYLLHNYFPPPSEHFVLNLASLDDDTHRMSIEHCKKAIKLSAELGGEKIAFHAGFYLDIPLTQIGKKIKKYQLFDIVSATKCFIDSVNELKTIAKENKVQLYFENNVISSDNYITYDKSNPLMLTDYDGLLELYEMTSFDLLLDVAHLKVSCNSMELDFENQLSKMFQLTDYIHVSDNNGLADLNEGIQQKLKSQLESLDWKQKTVTLEVYDSMASLKSSFEIIKKLKDNAA
jgi:sugar phosphate isomerase/epimerase